MRRPAKNGITRHLMFGALSSLVILCAVFADEGFAALSDQILSIGISSQSTGILVAAPLNQEITTGQVDRTSQLFPGAISLKPLREDRLRIASLSRNLRMVDSSDLIDGKDLLDEVGKRVGEPIGLYSRFEIEVERSSFSVKLFAYGDEGKKDELFSCKAGLGSSEFPTPKGSFYILRIFDDHPIWIPPPDRDWAYGQSPSRSVYGGHMMPFFSKVQASKPPVNDDIETETDAVAPPMKMVDLGAYRIHGTDSPWSVGSAQSHGCVRLVNSSVAQLADTLKMYVGTTTRGEGPNGVFINLAKPVKLTLY